jgi:hypothetical protein
MIEDIKKIETLIRLKTNLLEEIDKNKPLLTFENTLNTELDILYSKLKYNGKIRLFIFDIFHKSFKDTNEEEDKKVDDKLFKIGIRKTQLKDKTFIYFIDDREFLQFYNYNNIRVYNRFYDGYIL